MEEYKKEVLTKSWQSTSYQQAIWNARRRLAGKPMANIGSLEAKILEENLLWDSKPDYSRWSHSDISLRRRPAPTPRISYQELSDENVEETLPTLPQVNVADKSPTLEFLSYVDPAPIHKTSDTSDLTPTNASSSFQDFGLCIGCFHKKGPHYHYQAPVRTGGGYTIYQKSKESTLFDDSNIKWNTVKWLANLGKSKDKLDRVEDQSLGFGDGFSAKLFHEFVNRGGNIPALKEYLESNFNSNVLDELKESGVDVELLQEFSDIYRNHIKVLLEENIQRQSMKAERGAKTLDFAVIYSSMENDGADMEMLITLIKKGNNHKSIINFENDGGNIEILEHFAHQILEDPSHDVIVFEFERILEKRKQHKRSQIFMDYLKSGGDVKTLKACLKEDRKSFQNALLSLPVDHIRLLQICLVQFSTEKEFLKEMQSFLEDHLDLYKGAELLQNYLESGGNMKSLKEYVAYDNTIVVQDEDGHLENDKETDIKLLKSVGNKFKKSRALKKILEEFPEEPQLIEAYIQSGGDFTFLVKAISNVTESPKLEEFVQEETNNTVRKLNMGQPKFVNTSSPMVVPTLLLPHILEKAIVDMTYNDLIDTEASLKKNEGGCLLKSVDLQSFTPTPVDSTDTDNRRRAIEIYRSFVASQTGESSSTYSSVTGKKRPKLWKPPKPFEVTGSRRSPTQPRNPFSQHRVFDISSLSEKQIMEVARQQRSHLDALRRDIKIEDFQKNWRLSITSPQGSIFSADSFTEINENSPLDQVISQPSSTPQTPSSPVEKKSRRQKQREKLRAAKKTTSDRRTPTKKSPTTSPNQLILPKDEIKTQKYVPKFDQIETESLPLDEEKVPDNEVKSTPEEQGSSEEDQVKEQEPETSPASKPEPKKKFPIIPKSEKVPEHRLRPESRKTSPRYATAFGPKSLTSSYSSILSANTMRRMRDNPQTMIESLEFEKKLTSKSDSNLSKSDFFQHERAERSFADELIRERLSAHHRKRYEKTNSQRKTSDPEANVSDYYPQEEFIDLLKKYCIVREDRIQLYRHIFDKYVLLKHVRDQEKKLEKRKLRRSLVGDSDIDCTTYEGQLKKNQAILQLTREHIRDVQEQIAIAKDSVSTATARIAFRKIEDSLKDDDKTNNKSQRAAHHSMTHKIALLKNLSANERRVCESDVDVRERKVVLAHLRAKAKGLKQREKSLQDTSKQLKKLIEQEMIDRRFQAREKLEFTRQQSRLYQELHPKVEEVIDATDLKSALNDLDNSLTFFDTSTLGEEIAKNNGVRFQVFCVIAALLETKNLGQSQSCSLNGKINLCKDYYVTMLGPDLNSLRIELKAAGITEKQQDQVMKKLSRGNNVGKLEFMDFIAYSPLFLAAHSKIIANPLA